MLVHLLTEVLEDVPKVLRGNKTAAQRIRTGEVRSIFQDLGELDA